MVMFYSLKGKMLRGNSIQIRFGRIKTKGLLTGGLFKLDFFTHLTAGGTNLHIIFIETRRDQSKIEWKNTNGNGKFWSPPPLPCIFSFICRKLR